MKKKLPYIDQYKDRYGKTRTYYRRNVSIRRVPRLWKHFRQHFSVHGFEEFPTTHGLRKDAVTALVESGCSPREIQAITGQSLQIIEHYAREYDRRKLAHGAVLKWEEHTKNR